MNISCQMQNVKTAERSTMKLISRNAIVTRYLGHLSLMTESTWLTLLLILFRQTLPT